MAPKRKPVRARQSESKGGAAARAANLRRAPRRQPATSLGAGSLFTSTEIPRPDTRPLKVYAFDPSAGRLVGNDMSAQVRYEPLKPGPVGERFAVIDYDGAQKRYYDPVDLENPDILIRGGLDPSQGDPRFHQQMVYAVASETLQRFERALGRRVHWRARQRVSGGSDPIPRGAATRLNLFPHAMCEANAFYSPEAHGILFGYFRASKTSPGRNLPGQTIFTCLSHDIIAHETTHAIVDGIRSYFTEPTNIDVPAFHEAFADLTALFVHFSHREVLLDTLQRTGGRLFRAQGRPDVASDSGPPVIQAQISGGNPLIELALQFGEAAGMRGALRGALNTLPNSDDIKFRTEPHERGSILVAAIFDAYFTIYTRRTASLFRIYRAGGGAEDPVDLPAPLAAHLADEASRTAGEFFCICARALDYCPPVDITFGDFLRSLITAHVDFDPSDPDGVRDALMQGFRLRGIWAETAEFFSEDSLCWPKIPHGRLTVPGLVFGDPNGLTRDEKNTNGEVLRRFAQQHGRVLGLDLKRGAIAAASFHPMFHTGEYGGLFVDMVVELVQTERVAFASNDPATGDFPLRNGVTLLVAQDATDGSVRPDARVRFVIPKPYSDERKERQSTYYGITGKAGGKGDDRFQIDFGLIHAGV